MTITKFVILSNFHHQKAKDKGKQRTKKSKGQRKAKDKEKQRTKESKGQGKAQDKGNPLEYALATPIWIHYILNPNFLLLQQIY